MRDTARDSRGSLITSRGVCFVQRWLHDSLASWHLQTLFATVHLWSEKNDFSLWSSLKDFYHDSSDLIVLSFVRIVCLSGLAYVGSLLAGSEAVVKEEAKLKPKVVARKEDPQVNGKVQHQVNGKTRNGEAIGDLKEPLLVKMDVKNEKPLTAYEEWFSGSSKKDIVLFASFLICTGFQVISHFQLIYQADRSIVKRDAGSPLSPELVPILLVRVSGSSLGCSFCVCH